MEYVEKMTMRIMGDLLKTNYCTGDKLRTIRNIEQIIADTRRGCWWSMRRWSGEQDEDMIHRHTELGLFEAVHIAEPQEEVD